MSLSPEQQSLKEDGNKALGAGDATRALALFSEALDLPGGSDAGRAILYSNRAAANMLIKDHQSALEDADSCIKLNADFPKGWSRKAAALHAMGKLREAAEFYRVASTKATSPDAAEEYNKLAAGCEQASSAGSAASSSQPHGPSAAAPSQSNSSSNVDFPPAVLAMRIVSFIMVFAWLLTSDPQYYKGSMILAAFSSIILVINAIGRPKFTVEYLERFLAVKVKPFFLLPIVYSSMSPVFPAMMNTQLIAIGQLARNSHEAVKKISPALASRIGEKTKNSPMLAQAMGIPEWGMLSTSERFSRFDSAMENACSRFELAVMLILVLQMFTPAGNIISLLIYPQVLKFRYLTNEPTRNTIHALDAALLRFSQRNAIADKVYQSIRKGVQWFGTQGIRNVQARRQNPAQNCVVM